MFKILAVALLLTTPTAFAGKHTSTNRSPASTPECRNAKCPMNMIHCEEGTHRVDIRAPGACCPNFKCEKPRRASDSACLHVACMQGQPSCNEGQILVNKAEDGACCPAWECMDDESEEL